MKRMRNLSALVWLRLLRVARKISHAGAGHIACYDLSDGLFDVLNQVATAEGLSQQELADNLLVTKGNISQLLGKLQARGLIEKRQQGRQKYVYLTSKGRELLDEIMPEHDDFVADHMAGLDQDEIRQLNRLLRKLDRSLD